MLYMSQGLSTVSTPSSPIPRRLDTCERDEAAAAALGDLLGYVMDKSHVLHARSLVVPRTPRIPLKNFHPVHFATSEEVSHTKTIEEAAFCLLHVFKHMAETAQKVVAAGPSSQEGAVAISDLGRAAVGRIGEWVVPFLRTLRERLARIPSLSLYRYPSPILAVVDLPPEGEGAAGGRRV